MVKLNRFGVIGILVAQSLLYSLPGWVLGVGTGFGVNYSVVKFIANQSSIPLDLIMPWTSILLSTVIAFGISLIASVVPISSVLSQNLHDSLDMDHSKNQIIKVSIERSESLKQLWTLLIGGVLFAGIGTGVCILFPYSLMSANLVLLGPMFFIMFLLILGSLVMMIANFEYLFERIFTTVFLFWETRSIRDLELKNLSAHRLRNRKTTLLYSISLAFIVFVNVMLTIAVDLIETIAYMMYGCDIDVMGYQSQTLVGFYFTDTSSRFNPNARYLSKPVELENIVDKYDDIVTNVAWATQEMEVVYSQLVKTQIANFGRSHAFYHQIIGITPTFIDKVSSDNMTITDEVKSGDSIIKSLYTNIADSLSTDLSNGFKKKMGGHTGDILMMNIVVEVEMLGSGSSMLDAAAAFLVKSLARYNITTTAYIESIPFFETPTKTMSASSQADAPLSIPSYLSIIPGNGGHLENIKYCHMFVTLKDKLDLIRREALYDELKAYLEDPNDKESTYEVWAYYNSLDGMKIAMLILNIIFYVVTIVIMILCFSLMSSMHTNVMEQGKEIGIMRALDLSRFQMVRVFIEEAFILVVTATIMGFFSGMVCGYLIISEMSSLQGLPAVLYFPPQLSLIMLGMAVVTSIFSALQPILSLTSDSIVNTIKSV